MLLPQYLRNALLCVAISTGVGCGGSEPSGPRPAPAPPPVPPPPPPVATTLSLQAGDGQLGSVGQPVNVPPRVRLVDQRGAPMGGVQVAFIVDSGGGSLTAPSVATDSDGGASTSWTLGTVAGSNNNRLVARVDGVATPVVFTASASAGEVRSVTVIDGSGQEGPPNVALPQALRVRTRDRYGNPTPERLLTWTASGGGVVANPTPTDSAGNASAVWSPGPAGEQRLTVAATGVLDSTAVFTATLTGNVTVTISLTNAYAVPGTETGPGAKTPTATRPIESVPGELLVRFRPSIAGGVTPGALSNPATNQAAKLAVDARLSRSLALTRSEVLGVSPTILTARVRIGAAATASQVAAQLTADPDVELVEPNYIAYGAPAAPSTRYLQAFRDVSSAARPSDPHYAFQAWHYHAIDVPGAWEVTRGRPDVIVAVVDDGIRFDHPDLQGQLTNDGYDFVSSMLVNRCGGGTVDLAGDGNGYDPDPTIPMAATYNTAMSCLGPPSSSGGHGLHVAGTIVARADNGAGGVGVAPGVRVRPVRVLNIRGSGTLYDIAQGILYAAGLPADDGAGNTVRPASGARIINLSLGGPATAAVLRNATLAATAAGSLLIAAAGNDGVSTPSYPAAYPEVVSVAATDPSNRDALYSNFGSTIDLSAPGGATGQGVDMGVYSTVWNFVTGSPGYAFWQGTSMAAPHVSGVAALVLSHQPGLSSSALRARLETTAVDIGSPGWDPLTGAGLVNARNAVTATLGRQGTYALFAYDAQSGARRGPVPVGSSSLTHSLPVGNWNVFVGGVWTGDDVAGLPGRRWGAVGGTASPSAVAVSPGGTTMRAITVGFPVEQEPNGTPGQANLLPIGGYHYGTTTNLADVDYYQVVVPAAGQVVFETAGWLDAACGLALSTETRLTLLSSTLATVAVNDDVNASGSNFCSRIVQYLEPGVYYLKVEGLPMLAGVARSTFYTVRAYSP